MKNDKLYALLFIVGATSLFASFLIKFLGYELFYTSMSCPCWFTDAMQLVIEFVMMVLQFMLIVACVTWLPFKEIRNKFIPLAFVSVIPYFTDKEYHVLMSFLITFSVVMILKPKIITIPSFVFNIFMLFLIQSALIAVKVNMPVGYNPFLDTATLLIVNIDQFLLLLGLYYINRKAGEKIELVLARYKR